MSPVAQGMDREGITPPRIPRDIGHELEQVRKSDWRHVGISARVTSVEIDNGLPDPTGVLGGIPRDQTGHAGGLPSAAPSMNGIAIQSKKGPILDVR